MSFVYKELYPAQLELIHCPSDVDADAAVYQGGFGSGKSFIGSLLGLMLAEKYRGVWGLVAAETLNALKITTIVSYLDHFDAMGFKQGEHYVYNKSESTIRFPMWDDSVILFRGLEKYDRLRSLNIGWAHIEEGSLVDKAAFDLIVSRLRHPKMGRKRIFITTNPQGRRGWIYDRFEKQGGVKEIPVITEAGLQSVSRVSYRRVIAPTTQNKSLDPAYIAMMLENMDDEMRRIYIMGQDGDDTGRLVCKTFTQDNIDTVAQYNPDEPIFLTCDFNIDPNCWLIAHHVNDECHFFDEICMNATTTECAEEFLRRYGRHRAGVKITGDASGANRGTLSSSVNENNYKQILAVCNAGGMIDVRLDVPPRNPPVQSRIDVWNISMCNFGGQRRIKINPKCKWLIYNCENLEYKINADDESDPVKKPSTNDIKNDTTNKIKYLSHPFDAASYLVFKLWPTVYNTVKRKRLPKAPPPSFGV